MYYKCYFFLLEFRRGPSLPNSALFKAILVVVATDQINNKVETDLTRRALHPIADDHG